MRRVLLPLQAFSCVGMALSAMLLLCFPLIESKKKDAKKIKEQQKKQHRKAKQQFRKLAMAAYQANDDSIWDNLDAMNDDVRPAIPLGLSCVQCACV